jgi:Protein kinase domain
MNTPSSSASIAAGAGRTTPDFPHGLDPKRLFEAVGAPTEAMPGGAARSTPSLDEVAAAFPQLEILALLGAGGMGAVFKARQPSLDRFVALKILPAELEASDPAFAERFAREGRLLARLNHPNIVAVHDFGRAGPFFYLIMEFVDGVNLRQAMRGNRFTPEEALALVPRICEALQFAHDEGVLHRDIKPENILLDARGRVKLADFGIAKLAGTIEPAVASGMSAEAGLTQAGAALGTPSYMAPEQRQHPGSVDHRADIYSLGVVFYELLTGELPVGKFAPPSATAAVDARIDVIVQRALEKDRALRQQSAQEMKTQVENVTRQGSAPSSRGTPPAPPAGHTMRPSQWSGLAITGAVLTALSVLFAVLVTFLLAYFHLSEAPAGPGAPGAVGAPAMPFGLVSVGPAFLMGFVGTLLGWFGLRDIRASGGAKRGRGLGMFAALSWPLLVAGAIEALVIGRMTLMLFRDIGPARMLALMGWLVVFGATCFGAIRLTSRWLRAPMATAAGTQPARGSSVGCLVAAIAAAVILPVVGLFGCYVLAYRSMRDSVKPAPEIRTSPASEALPPPAPRAPEAPLPPR